ncbi:MAG TPA: chromosomal replication initiator protein DnaA [Victivallales bacterium]|nr:chromosomal replication initiator protein DnaA [Victivallales bacterium]
MEEVSPKEKIWLSARNILRNRLSDDIYNRWIRSIQPIAYDKEFILGVSDDFFADWLEEHFSDDISDALKKASDRDDIIFKFEVGHLPEEEAAKEKTGDSKVPENVKENLDHEIANCNSKFTFDTFVVGDGSNFAYSAAVAVSQAPGYSFNPLFIYGGTGLGKTHLIQAAAHEAVKLKKNFYVEYLTCEEFFNLYIEAIQNNKFTEFRKRFRNTDMLLIDDVQFLAKKNKMQEEFFNTFNALYNYNKQIVLTSDRSPSEIDGLEARLVSRFENGLTTDIQPPGLETRMAILRKKQEEQAVKLDDDVLYFMASRITSNVRRLEGALIRLTAFSSMAGTNITLDIAERLLHPIIMQEAVSKVTIEMVQKKVAEFYDLRMNDLLGSKRPKNIAYPRMIAMYLARELTENSLPEIGDAFGGRTHATVINAINKVRKERTKDKKVDHSISLIQRQLQCN